MVLRKIGSDTPKLFFWNLLEENKILRFTVCSRLFGLQLRDALDPERRRLLAMRMQSVRNPQLCTSIMCMYILVHQN
eukprot:m.219378 g.219378  ORF g.219378 m.219378 type:complete len:77 (-) comp15110_c0_seq17:2476-2706(-)